MAPQGCPCCRVRAVVLHEGSDQVLQRGPFGSASTPPALCFDRCAQRRALLTPFRLFCLNSVLNQKLCETGRLGCSRCSEMG